MAANSGYTLSIECILREAKFRWLKGYEVLCILQNYQHYGLQLSPAAPVEPQSGSLFLFNKRLVKFRKDGVNWRKQKDGKTVRESHEKLKVGGIKVLSCCYTRSADNLAFQRRIYWLLDGDQTTVLVHYLTLDKDGICRDDGSVFDQGTWDEYDSPPDIKYPSYRTKKDFTDDDRENGSASDISGDEDSECVYGKSQLHMSSSYNDSVLEFVNSFITPNENGSQVSNATPKYTVPPLPIITGGDVICNPVPSCLGRLAKITDFSPEWDYIEGGTKILIFGPDFHNGLSYYCMFDQCEVPAELIQDGVLRCKAPAHYQPGLVSFCITRGNFSLFSEVRQFEYRTRDSPSEYLTMNERTFKLRIIERLERLEREVNSANVIAPHSDTILENLTQNMEDKCYSEQQLEQMFVKILDNLMKGLESSDTLNDQDVDGLTLLHYACALRYHLLASTLIQHGANVNIQDKTGSSPFNVAMRNKDQEMIKTLVDYVDLNKSYDTIKTLESYNNISPKPQGRSPVMDGIISGLDGLGIKLEKEEGTSPLPTNFRKLKDREGSTHSSPRTPIKARQTVVRQEEEETCNSPNSFKNTRARRVEIAADDIKKRAAKARDSKIAQRRK